MAVHSNQVNVGTTAGELITAQGDGMELLIRNRGAATIYIGGSDVTTGNGFAVDANESVTCDLGPGESVWAVAGSGTIPVHYFATWD